MLGVCYSIEGVDGVGLVPVASCSPYKLGTFGSSSTSDYAICGWSVRSSSSSSSSSTVAFIACAEEKALSNCVSSSHTLRRAHRLVLLGLEEPGARAAR